MTELLSGVNVSQCQETDFAEVEKLIELLQLDNNDLNYNQFLVAKYQDKIIGFGRLRNYSSSNELCSLGVVEPHRFKGVGTELAKSLIKRSNKPLFVVTIIPSFFNRLGFIETSTFPVEIGQKISYCTSSLPVEETYIAMQLK